MQIAELSGDNAVPREEVFPRFALASSGSFHIRGVLKKERETLIAVSVQLCEKVPLM